MTEKFYRVREKATGEFVGKAHYATVGGAKKSLGDMWRYWRHTACGDYASEDAFVAGHEVVEFEIREVGPVRQGGAGLPERPPLRARGFR